MSGDISPYDILDVSRNCSLEALKSKFKNLAIKYHPDKGGDKYIFDLITSSFKTIYRELKDRDNNKQFHDLKTDARINSNEVKDYVVADDTFADRFNAYFDENKTVDANMERGYKNFIEEDKVKTSRKHYKLKKYSEPSGSILCKSLNFIELGVDTDDFSGKNDDRHRLQYMDYQYAHTTDKLIDPNNVKKRQDYKNLDDLKSKRSKENFEMTNKEKKYHEYQSNLKEKKEQKRIHNLNAYDSYLQDHSSRTKNLLVA